MIVTIIKNCIGAAAIAGLLAFSTMPAMAARDVQSSLVALKAALADLVTATVYYGADATETTTAVSIGVSDFNKSLNIRRPDAQAVLDQYIADTGGENRVGQRVNMIRTVQNQLNAATAGLRNSETLRDIFYYEFVQRLAVVGQQRNLLTTLTRLFGGNEGQSLFDRYTLAVSRTR